MPDEGMRSFDIKKRQIERGYKENEEKKTHWYLLGQKVEDEDTGLKTVCRLQVQFGFFYLYCFIITKWKLVDWFMKSYYEQEENHHLFEEAIF